MRNIWLVFKKELKSFTLSPLAYVVIAAFLALGGYFYSAIIIVTNKAEMTGYFANMGITMMFLVPVLTMRLWAEEEQQGTTELLLTTPVTIPQLVIGKYLAALAVLIMGLVLTGIYLIILKVVGKPDFGSILVNYLGFILLVGTYTAIGLFTSSLSKSQMIAGITGFGILLVLWTVGWIGPSMPLSVGKVLQAVSFTEHIVDFYKGVIDTSHALFFVSLIVFFLYATARNIERKTLG